MQEPQHLPEGWQRLSSDYLFQEPPWLTVRKDHLLLPNGQDIPGYFVLEYPMWVNTVGITREGDFVFVRQYRHGLGQSSYELCAGVHEAADASFLETARREMLEETGYGGGEWQPWMVLSANPATHSNLTYCFLATGLELQAQPSLDATEELTVHLFSKEEVKALLLEDAVVQALHAAPLWKYLALHP